jgi:hypothetical protein
MLTEYPTPMHTQRGGQLSERAQIGFDPRGIKYLGYWRAPLRRRQRDA